MIFNPLEQFRIQVLKKICFSGIDISITNNTIILLIVLTGFTFLFYVNNSSNTYILSK